MEKEVQERFERIERNLERVSERLGGMTEHMGQITTAHLELEAAQKNTHTALDRLSEQVKENTENIANLTILVDRLVAKDLGRQ